MSVSVSRNETPPLQREERQPRFLSTGTGSSLP